MLNRFSIVVENAKWMVFDTVERTYVWECGTQEAAQKFADAKNAKEGLRTAQIVSSEPLSEHLKRIAATRATET